MLKKISLSFMLFVASLFSFAQANDVLKDGEQYTTLNRTATAAEQNEIIEFLSFTCGACYMMETQGGYEIIKDNLPEGTKFTRYLLTNDSPFSTALNQSWAIANELGIEKAYANEVFKGFFDTRSLTPNSDESDLIKIFERLGVSADKYQAMKFNPKVAIFLKAQAEKANELQPRFTPSIFVNGKYLVNPNGLDQSSVQAFFTDYSRVVNQLLKK